MELEDVRRHLAGEITLGIYAINPETQRVKWMGIDAGLQAVTRRLAEIAI